MANGRHFRRIPRINTFIISKIKYIEEGSVLVALVTTVKLFLFLLWPCIAPFHICVSLINT